MAALVATGCGGAGTSRDPADSSTGGLGGGAATATAASASNATPRSDAGAPGGAVRPDRRRRIVFLGTSLTAGLGVEPEEAFPSRIQEKIDSAGLPFEVSNAGVSGETSAGALRRISWLLREPFDVLVIETGANDGLRALNIDSAKANIRSIITQVRAAQPDARILLVPMEAPPNLGTRYTSEFRGMFPQLARENDVVLLPFLLEGVAGNAALNQGDGIHPSPEGARRAAANLWPAIERELRSVLVAKP